MRFFAAAVMLFIFLAPTAAPANEFDDALTTLADQTEAAANGSATAQYNLGMRYAIGDGVEQNWETAAKWLQLSADSGDMDAQASLGTMYQKGQGVKKDDSEAVRLYLAAARQGHRQAQYNLGAMYASGRGTHVNNKEAYFWLSLASTLPNADVEALKSGIEGNLSASELAEIEKRVEDFRPEVRTSREPGVDMFRTQ